MRLTRINESDTVKRHIDRRLVLFGILILILEITLKCL